MDGLSRHLYDQSGLSTYISMSLFIYRVSHNSCLIFPQKDEQLIRAIYYGTTGIYSISLFIYLCINLSIYNSIYVIHIFTIFFSPSIEQSINLYVCRFICLNFIFLYIRHYLYKLIIDREWSQDFWRPSSCGGRGCDPCAPSWSRGPGLVPLGAPCPPPAG